MTVTFDQAEQAIRTMVLRLKPTDYMFTVEAAGEVWDVYLGGRRGQPFTIAFRLFGGEQGEERRLEISVAHPGKLSAERVAELIAEDAPS